MQETVAVIGRNQFKCYQCRLIFAQRDGDWFDYDGMQIHLCRKCEKVMMQKKQQRAAFASQGKTAAMAVQVG